MIEPPLHCFLQKVHMFQRSVEAVTQKLTEAERGGGFLSTLGVNAKTDADIHAFRNQLKEYQTTGGNKNKAVVL